jgi:hypothetical protein
MTDADGVGTPMNAASKEIVMQRESSLLAALAGCAAVLFAEAAAARYVVVNGERLNTADIQYLDRISCSRVPDGRYWIDMRSGIWGYERGGMQGHIADRCNTRRPGLSERRLLYSPGELLR